ncbi:anaerobic ribonucleoside-triphosphate reductase [Enterobacter asburiae]|uniref:Anaerobic ribonucleoside-triphosphate reductase n=1 Tax=Enterobacter asburiae TaxID=61645 RepID=A0A376FJK4_ENTAS|nr:anaerobic ribonucleoside-triphosphate reductase [Enterobacter asburiae]
MRKASRLFSACATAVDQWKEETGYGFSLYSTPSENLCDRFCRLDTAEFGIVEGVTDKGYYTNSFHLDVEKKVNPYDKIDFEAAYPPIASGGFICYGEYPNIQHNLKALEDVWDYSYQHVPYYGTNTPIDECYECGLYRRVRVYEQRLHLPEMRQPRCGPRLRDPSRGAAISAARTRVRLTQGSRKR